MLKAQFSGSSLPYTHSLGYFIQSHSFKCHLTAVIPKVLSPAQTHLLNLRLIDESSLLGISLTLNVLKTELLIASRLVPPAIFPISVKSNSSLLVAQTKNLGILTGCFLHVPHRVQQQILLAQTVQNLPTLWPPLCISTVIHWI